MKRYLVRENLSENLFCCVMWGKIQIIFQITVAIIGNETLDTLQDWAEEIFTSIPNKEKTKPGT